MWDPEAEDKGNALSGGSCCGGCQRDGAFRSTLCALFSIFVSQLGPSRFSPETAIVLIHLCSYLSLGISFAMHTEQQHPLCVL